MMNRRYWRLFLASIPGLLLAIAGAVWSPTASASTDRNGPKGPGLNCAYSLETAAVRCFATATEAISFASGGTVAKAPSDFRDAVRDPKLTEQINNAKAPAVLIGVEYYLENYGTPALYYYGSHSCTTTISDVDYYSAPLPTVSGINWNNNIRSFAAYNNCWQRLYDYPNCTGTYYGYSGYSVDLGSFRDRAECIYWS